MVTVFEFIPPSYGANEASVFKNGQMKCRVNKTVVYFRFLMMSTELKGVFRTAIFVKGKNFNFFLSQRAKKILLLVGF